KDMDTFDIHDKVNYSVEKADILVFKTQKGNVIRLVMEIDKTISPVFDYFEIFMERMMLCRKAAEFLNASFQFNINDAKLL
ncbi:MAG: phosphohydrolase, partial [Defluviitaleaceae bacterium]|nr:phosphohydrolase [Defluviitaleaceae bacterium]